MKVALSRVFETYDDQEMFEYAVEETAKVAALGYLESVSRSLTGLSALVPEGQVSLKGLDAMIVKFLGGIGEYSNSEMVELFEKIDTDGSGFIDRTEFDEFITLAMSGRTALLQQAKAEMDSKSIVQSSSSSLIHRSSTRSSVGTSESSMKSISEHNTVGSSSFDHLTQTRKFDSALGDERTIEYVKTIADDTDESGNPLEDWSVFYCGGSKNIKANLKEISRKYGINFAVEKFDW
jgi:hypothetical protein